MHLSADTIDELAVGVDALDEADHSYSGQIVSDKFSLVLRRRRTLDLSIVRVQVVVVDVEPKSSDVSVSRPHQAR